MTSNELSLEVRGSVGIAMTGASFDAAQEAGVTRIEADIDAMRAIAHEIGFTPHDKELPLLLL